MKIYNSGKYKLEIIKLYISNNLFKNYIYQYFMKLFTFGFKIIIEYYDILKYLNLNQFREIGEKKYNYIENKINLRILYFKSSRLHFELNLLEENLNYSMKKETFLIMCNSNCYGASYYYSFIKSIFYNNLNDIKKIIYI